MTTVKEMMEEMEYSDGCGHPYLERDLRIFSLRDGYETPLKSHVEEVYALYLKCIGIGRFYTRDEVVAIALGKELV